MMQEELRQAEDAVEESGLDEFLVKGDTAADKLVLKFKLEQGNRGVDELENLLIKLFRYPSEDPKQAPPKEFVDFLRAKDDLPAWFKEEGGWNRVAKGQKLYGKYRLTALLILGCASLPQCYANSEIASTLIMSGRLASQVRLRLGETGNFLDMVMKPGALQENGAGLQWIRKVRLIHAAMRALINEDPAQYEQRARTGQVGDVLLRMQARKDRMPIDQVEMAFVLLTFSLIVLEGWRSLGIEPTDEECNDYMFTWAAIGHLLGIRPELVARCKKLPDARALRAEIEALHKLNGRSDAAAEAGRLLSAALLVLLRDRVVSGAPVPWWLRWTLPTLPQSLVRRLVGRKTAGALWVQRAPVLPLLAHWLMIAFGAFGRRTSETDLCRGMGSRIEQEFCGGAPTFRSRA